MRDATVELQTTLLHLTTLAAWIDAVRAGQFVTESLSVEGFIHLSASAQVTLPANALFEGRRDTWLLVVDPARLSAPLRWEPGSPRDSTSMEFPHLYGPLNLDAVVALVPYPCRPDGWFDPPADLPETNDQAGRALALEWYLARARSTRSREIPSGVSVRHEDFSVSWEHNRVIVGRAPDPDAAAALCARELAGLEHWQVCVVGAVETATIGAYLAAGWTHAENLLMALRRIPRSPPPDDQPEVDRPRIRRPGVGRRGVDQPAGDQPGIEVRAVEIDELAAFRIDLCRRYTPSLGATALRQMLDRDRLTDEVARVDHLAVFHGGAVVAQTDCFVVGATAQLESVETDPDHRCRGYATALVLAAVERAGACGADVVFLRADANDWVWQLYERLGFATVGTSHVFDRELGTVVDGPAD